MCEFLTPGLDPKTIARRKLLPQPTGWVKSMKSPNTNHEDPNEFLIAYFLANETKQVSFCYD